MTGRTGRPTARSQTAVMTIGPGEETGPEAAHAADQIVYVIDGEATLTIEGPPTGRPRRVRADPRGGAPLRNPGASPLLFLTVYAPLAC